MNKNAMPLLLNRFALILLHSSFILGFLGLSGCTLLGALAGKALPPPTVAAQYAGLQNQSIAILVWAPEGTLIDFPDVRLDVAGGLQNKLVQAQNAKAKELTGITFPARPAAIVRLQENHPEYEALPLSEVAPKLGTSRVIYVEIENLQTRADASVELYRGSASATLKVVEVPPGGGPGIVVYDESGVPAVFPPKSREEGTPNGNDFAIYRGTVDELTSAIAMRFVSHPEEQ
jgi:hypothetical protein